MKVIGVIPSRFGSTRFPGKPLADIEGKTMIRRVYEQAVMASSLSDVLVATDDERIMKEVLGFGGKVMMTSSHHKNGTERCAEIAANSDADVIINIQGDEPFLHPEQIDMLASQFIGEVKIGTLIKVHPLNEELQNPSRVKVVVNKKLEALYFSRSIIPFLHKTSHVTVQGFIADDKQHTLDERTTGTTFYKHIGLYGYRKDILQQIVKLPESALEKAESLEQLRWLENGYRIQCSITSHEAISIDTPEDLKNLKNLRM